jgi:predicted 3-demethylubiquinone-9 3-methyltransferase (glyoxalase superfamily)
MDDTELVALLREEAADASSFYSSEVAQAQADAMERYTAQPYGDEVEGRSQVVTHDVEDTINWCMPHIMRLYLAKG